ncbi:uncharacterized protein At4g15970-like [Typha angustifolia]|uniref:uncharacterized protein At4g15970-like n=1 Tax=Typha angustifolia TaxID=59011 RepID=UPI003C2DDF3B
MVSKVMGDMNNLQPLISFLLGAALATACLLFYLSADPRGRSMEISAWSNGTQRGFIEEVTTGTKVDSAPVVNKTRLASAAKEKSSAEELAQLLKDVATEDKTVILTEINEAWSEPNSLVDLFLESFHVGEQTEHLLDHLLIIAMDPKAFERCKVVHRHCYFLKTEGISYNTEQVYNTKDYLDMMWGRNMFQQSILEMGYNFLFTDVDIMWLRDPLRRIAITSDIAISSDFFFGDEDSMRNFPNGGFLYAKSSNKTIEFYKNWQLARERFPGKHEQHIFNQIKGEFSARFQVRIQFLDTAYCTGFCQLSKDLNKVTTIHANCCVGLGAKLHDLKNVLEDWKAYKAGTPEERISGKYQWRVPGICIH